MSADLPRLQGLVAAIMRVGVALSAAALIAGLALAAGGHSFAPTALKAGLVMLMIIPAARIIATLSDALARRDGLLIGATAVVAAVLLWQFFHPL